MLPSESWMIEQRSFAPPAGPQTPHRPRPELVRSTSADPLIRRLESFSSISELDRVFLRSLPPRPHSYASGEELCAEGAAIGPRLIVSGWACRLRYLPDGRRQIVSLLLPGDTFGLPLQPEVAALSALAALTPLETMNVRPLAAALQSGTPQHASLARAFAEASIAEEARFLDQMVRLGRMTAYERTAHLLLELGDRSAAAGLGDDRFPLPLTQEMMADALGLSVVHVNRTVQQLRRDRMIVLKSGRVELLDFERLAGVANYVSPPWRLGAQSNSRRMSHAYA